MPEISVYGLSRDELDALKLLAKRHYGKASVSWMAKRLLQEQLDKPEPEPIPLPLSKRNRRVTLRLPEKDLAYLDAAAESYGCSINDVCRNIIRSHIHRHPFLYAAEVQALYQSNHELMREGRNLNQMVRQMNFGGGVSLTLQYVIDLRNFIEAHVAKVGRVLHANRKRER